MEFHKNRIEEQGDTLLEEMTPEIFLEKNSEADKRNKVYSNKMKEHQKPNTKENVLKEPEKNQIIFYVAKK